MKNAYLLKEAEVSDASHIKAIITESFEKYVKIAGIPGTAEALEESVEDIIRDIGQNEVFIVFADGEPAGSIRVKLQPDNTAYITRFGVRPRYSNRGIGTALINAVDKLLESKGVARAYLHTASSHPELMRFYTARGFSVHSVSYDRGYPRAYMVKEYPINS